MRSNYHQPDIRPSELLRQDPLPLAQPVLFPTLRRPRRFAFKRHRASTLHTDFRIEVYGILLSWVHWGHPSLDPRRRISLREMADHQVEYMLSERRIPDGLYGAGPMIVWDHGTYDPLAYIGDDEERAVILALRNGRFDFRLNGTWLRGAFRMELGARGWELMKLEDEFATVEPIKWQDVSVLSGKSLDEIEAEYQATMLRLRRP